MKQRDFINSWIHNYRILHRASSCTSTLNLLFLCAVFVIGCFGLPWLWLLNALYFYPAIKDNSASLDVKTCMNKLHNKRLMLVTPPQMLTRALTAVCTCCMLHAAVCRGVSIILWKCGAVLRTLRVGGDLSDLVAGLDGRHGLHGQCSR
mgnify:CR=1 FL=1